MWPWYTDKSFEIKVKSKKEIEEWSHDTNKECFMDYQNMLSRYINPSTPYSEILLYLQTGTGKTLASIAIAENFIRLEGRKVVVLTKNEDLAWNFKNELISTCSRYGSEEEIKRHLKGDQETTKELLKRIKSYSFISHEMFKKNKFSKLSDKVIIIDEIHNLLSDKGYDIVMKMLANSVNYKLILLSATPAYDKVDDILKVSNILNARDPRLHFNLDDKSLFKNVKLDIPLFSGNIKELSDKCMGILRNTLKGKVYFKKTDPKNFPKKIMNGIEICEMSEFQEERYNKIIDEVNTENFGTVANYASGIIYPDTDGYTMVGPAGYEKYVEKYSGILKMPKLGEYSCKLAKMIDNINKSTGKSFIFSNYITDDGVQLIKRALIANGIRDYIVLTSDISPIKRKRAIQKFNSPKNDDGSMARIVIASSVVSEGVTFKSIRNLHIYEPAWNLSEMDQVIGRAVRNGSHSTLPEEERYVKIHMYAATPSNHDKSFEISKYKLATEKDKVIKKVERLVIENSFTCEDHIQEGVDYSRECEYTKCKVKCDHNSDVTNVDFSTYNYNERITELFKESNVWSVADIALELELPVNTTKIIMKTIYDTGVIETINHQYYLSKDPEPIIVKPIITVRDGILFIKNASTGKDKNCLNFAKGELVNILKNAGEKVDERHSKKILCEQIKSNGSANQASA